MSTVNWRSLPISNQHIGQIEAKVGKSKALSLELVPHGSPEQCYWNVAELVKAEGGAIVFGWRIRWLPDVIIQAQHHAVWQDAQGNLLDPSPPPHKSDTFSTFIRDDASKVDFSCPPVIDNIQCPLRDSNVLREFASLSLQQMAQTRRVVELFRAAGATFIRGGMLADARISFLVAKDHAAIQAEQSRTSELMGICISRMNKWSMRSS